MSIIHEYAINAIVFALLALFIAKFMDFTSYKSDKQAFGEIITWFINQNQVKIGNKRVKYRNIYVIVTGSILLSFLLFL